MQLHIYHGPEELTFLLKRGKTIIKKEIYRPNKNSREFLEFLDKFLKSFKIKITEIKSYNLRQSKHIGFTARRVVKAIVNALNFR